MLKITALLFNTFALLIYQLFFTDVITITQSAPSSAKAETEFIVEVTVKKGDIKSFSKLQLDLPIGFTAVEDKSNGASFTFVNQSVKFVWLALPAEKEFKVSYKVIVAAGTSGDKVITGKLSYIIDNVKNFANLEPPTTITVGDGTQPAVAVNTSTPTPVVPPNPPVTPNPPIPPPPQGGTQGSDGVTITDANGAEIVINCMRTTAQTAKSPSEFPVEITIKKANLDGFAKYVETLPVGFSATVIEAKGAAFTFDDQKAKFVWGTLPSDAEFKISYKITVAPNINADQLIEGIFSFINPSNQQTAKFVLQPTTIKTGTSEAPSQIAGNTPTPPPVKPPPIVTPPPASGGEVATGGTKPKNPDPVIPKPLQGNVIPPQAKVYYKVQVMALRRNRTKEEVASLLNITEQLDPIEQHQGLNKYVLGYHTVYKEARDHREQMPKAVIVPWVVAYSQGRRTTVQDALMITSQQWFR